MTVRFGFSVALCVALVVALGIGFLGSVYDVPVGPIPAILVFAVVLVLAWIVSVVYARSLTKTMENLKRENERLSAELGTIKEQLGQERAELESKVEARTIALKGEVEERRRVARALNHRLEFERRITGLSSHFISLRRGEVNEGIKWALGEISEFAQVDRAYVFVLSEDKKYFNLAHRWRSSDDPAQEPGLQRIPVEELKMTAAAIKDNRPVIVPSVAALPPEAGAIKARLETQGVKSVINLPLYWEGEAIGFLGLSVTRQERHWADEEISLLTIVGQIISGVIVRNDAEDDLARHRVSLEERVEERTAELILAKEKAEQASLAKSAFLSSMSHELRTPLNAVMGFSQLLQTTQGIDGQGQHFIKRILDASDHLLKLIDQILDLSNIEAGAVVLNLEDFDPDDLAHECCEQLIPSGTARNISLAHNPGRKPTGEANRVKVRADRGRLKQVLIHLLDNGVKYIEEGGVISISGIVEKSHYRFIVADDGPGISQDRLDTLFKPFTRATKKHGVIGGAGVGLSIARKLAMMMGGRMGVDSKEGQGTTFWVEVPLAPPGRNIGETGRETLASSAHKILYIEDNPSNMEFLRELIALYPQLTLLEAETAEDGVELAKAEIPDLVFMDVNLPGMDGIEALDLLRSWDETKTIQVIALSANAMPDDLDKGRLAGFDGYLTKPVEPGRIIEAINSAAPPKS